jgi:pyruvate,water dikinase
MSVFIRADDAFQVHWEDPADAERTWTWDQMHGPKPLCPLAASVSEGHMKTLGGRRLLVNGYQYFSMDGAPPGATFASLPPGMTPLRVWEETNRPRIRQICDRIRLADYASTSAVQLAAALEGLIEDSASAFALTFGSVMGFGMQTGLLLEFLVGEFGPEGQLRTAMLLQGFENESSSAGARLGRLAEIAAGLPAVAAALREGRFGDLERLPGGETFLQELRDYLEEYGWRANTWSDLEDPTWAEDPSVPLRLIARYLTEPARSPAVAMRRAVEQREEVERETEARLSPDKRERFRGHLRAAREHVTVSEGRAMYQLISVGVLRVPILELGRKLVAAGALESPDDVFYLTLEELKELAGGSPRFAVGAVVRERRADHQRWTKLIPPRYLGKPPAPSAQPAFVDTFFGYGVVVSQEEQIVNGIGASPGTVRGRARLVLDLNEADRLESGDVLVCPSTAAPWTPLFAIAGAVVTDSGGILSHSAICAREYAIPAVVGAVVATRKIPDGALVTVDGRQGIVRIEERP